MSCADWMDFNLITATGTTLLASTEDALFPVENIQHDHTTKVFRTPVGTLSATVVFDFKTTEPVNYLLYTPSSIDGVGFAGTLLFEANATNEWSSPAFSTTLAMNNTFDIGIKRLASDESYRFWRVTASNTGQFVELSKIFIGKSTTFTTNAIAPGWTRENRDLSRNKKNRFGQKFTDKIGNQEFYRVTYKLLDISEVETLLDMTDLIGNHTPFWFILDRGENIITDQERLAGYFTFRNRPRTRNSSFALYDMSLSLEEAK